MELAAHFPGLGAALQHEHRYKSENEDAD